MPDVTREELDAKLEVSILRIENVVNKFDGKLETVTQSLGRIEETNRAIRDNQWIIGLTVIAVVAAILALFPAFFSIGDRVHEITDNSVQKLKVDQIADIRSEIEKLSEQLKLIEENFARPPAPQPPGKP
jgi:hypothetical protein